MGKGDLFADDRDYRAEELYFQHRKKQKHKRRKKRMTKQRQRELMAWNEKFYGGKKDG